MLGLADGPAEAGPVRNGALLVWLSVAVGPSGSAAEPVTVTRAFSEPLTVAGAVMFGFWLPPAAAGRPSTSNQSLPSLSVLSRSLPEQAEPKLVRSVAWRPLGPTMLTAGAPP